MLNKWLIPYFGGTDIAKLDLAAVTAFDARRTEQNGKVPAQSTINNHNAALKRVLDEAELNGWMVKSLRPTLLNKGVKTESRGSFTVEEYRTIYTALRGYHKQTTNEKSAATRETLRNYVLLLANTGVRHGTEALGLCWRNIEWYERDGERYLAINVDGKTNKRTAIARDRVVDFLWRQAQLNSKISVVDFDALIVAKLDEPVFTTRLGAVATVPNLNRAFNSFLDDLNLKTGSGWQNTDAIQLAALVMNVPRPLCDEQPLSPMSSNHDANILTTACGEVFSERSVRIRRRVSIINDDAHVLA